MKSAFSLLLVLLGITLFSSNNNQVQARVITDDQGVQVDVPDSYFLKNADVIDANLKRQGDQMKPILKAWTENPNTQMSDISARMAMKYPDLTTFNEVTETFHKLEPQESKEEISNELAMYTNDPYQFLKMMFAGYLDTEKVLIFNGTFERIAQPSHMTFYNQTGNKKVDYALKNAFAQWSKQDPRFKFSMVNNRRYAKVIVTGMSQAQINDSNFEPNYSAAFIPTITYYQVLIQGQLVLSPKVLAMDQNDPNFLHTIVHEVGHSIGRVDLI